MNTTLTKDDTAKLRKNLLNKLMLDISNKYQRLIAEREFNMKQFKVDINKNILILSLKSNPFYKPLFTKVERHFLKAIAESPEKQYHGLLTATTLKPFISASSKFAFDKGLASFPSKITIRSMIASYKQSPSPPQPSYK